VDLVDDGKGREKKERIARGRNDEVKDDDACGSGRRDSAVWSRKALNIVARPMPRTNPINKDHCSRLLLTPARMWLGP